mgnify:CR=1 FL=1
MVVERLGERRLDVLDGTASRDFVAEFAFVAAMTAIDATGLHELEKLTDRLRATGRTLLLCGARSQPGRSVLMKLEDSYRVNATEALFGDLKVILGPRCLAG